MRVDQAGKDRRISEIDDLGDRFGPLPSDRLNTVVVDNDKDRPDDKFVAREEPSGRERDRHCCDDGRPPFRYLSRKASSRRFMSSRFAAMRKPCGSFGYVLLSKGLWSSVRIFTTISN